MDPESGWCEIRPYCSNTWKFMRAAYKCPFFLLSATMEESSLCRILGIPDRLRSIIELNNTSLETLEISRADISVLYMCPDRPNIYGQIRNVKNTIDVM